uniref:Ovule protein n=1 Tax=Strongyloides papillosus TaxID=174720 RepID=A0A0N5BXR3_STREA
MKNKFPTRASLLFNNKKLNTVLNIKHGKFMLLKTLNLIHVHLITISHSISLYCTNLERCTANCIS